MRAPSPFFFLSSRRFEGPGMHAGLDQFAFFSFFPPVQHRKAAAFPSFFFFPLFRLQWSSA